MNDTARLLSIAKAMVYRHPGHATQKVHGRRYGASGEVLETGKYKRKDVVKGAKGKGSTKEATKPPTKKETGKADSKFGYLSKDHQKMEESIASLQNEKAGVFDKNGNKLFEVDGGKDNVTFTDSQLVKMKGAVVTHNHPNFDGKYSDGGSFSTSDVQLMINTGASEVRAVTEKYIYRISPKIIGATNLTQGTAAMDFARQTQTKLKSAYAEKIKKGKLKPRDMFEQYSHEVWSTVAEQGFVVYERIPR